MKWVVLGRWTLYRPLYMGRGAKDNPLTFEDMVPVLQMLAERAALDAPAAPSGEQ